MTLRESVKGLKKKLLGDDKDTVEDPRLKTLIRMEKNRNRPAKIPTYLMILKERQEGGNDNYNPFREQFYLVTSDGVFQSIPTGFMEDPQLAAIVQSNSPAPFMPDLFDIAPDDYSKNGWFTPAYHENLVANSVQFDRFEGTVDLKEGQTTARLVSNVDTIDDVMTSFDDNPELKTLLETIQLEPFYVQEGKHEYAIHEGQEYAPTPIPVLAEGESKGGDGESGSIIYRPPTGEQPAVHQARTRNTPQPEAFVEDHKPTLRDLPPAVVLADDDMEEIGPNDPLYRQ